MGSNMTGAQIGTKFGKRKHEETNLENNYRHIKTIQENNKNKKDNLNIFHINIQSIRNKLEELEAFLGTLPNHVLCINEHWLKREEVYMYVPAGYELVTIYCRAKNGYGGVSIFFKNNIKVEHAVLDIEKFCVEQIFEVVGVTFPKSKLVIISLYSTPNTDVNDFIKCWERLTRYLEKYKKYDIIYIGDININILEKSTAKNIFEDTLSAYNFHLMNNLPTRNNACLDNIISNSKKDTITFEVLEPHLSDHSGLWLVYPVLENKLTEEKQVKVFRLINETNIGKLKYYLAHHDWKEAIILSNSSNDAFNRFMYILTSYLNDTCPIKTKTITKQKNNRKKHLYNWYTTNLSMLRNRMIILHEKTKKGTLKDKERYKDMKKTYRREIKMAKIKANDNYILNSKNRYKAAWDTINNETGRSKNKFDMIEIEPNILNEYFINIHKNTSELNNTEHLNSKTEKQTSLIDNDEYSNISKTSFRWQEIKPQDILKTVTKLSNSNCEDFYGFSNSIIKNIIFEIIQPLTYLINWTLKEKKFPECLKISKIIPVYKKGDRKCPSNYRPLSIVPIIAKIIEDSMKTQLVEHFSNNGLMNNCQYGFRIGCSTSMAVESLVVEILHNFEQGIISSATLLDLSKAFDSVSHNILLNKLEKYGIRGDEKSLLETYLKDRYQTVIVGNKKSDLCKVKTGVAQGSILGPFLFLVYINDLADQLPCKIMLYADDITLLTSDKNLNNIKRKNENALQIASCWLNKNQLTLNKDKTEMIYFYLNKTEFDANHDKQVKLLGIHLDPKLNWNVHTQQLCKKLASVIYLLHKLNKTVSKETILTAYYALFHTHLTYGVTLWGNSSGSKEVFKWQKRAIRCMKNKTELESCRPLFKELGIMTLPSIYIFFTLLRIKENLNKYPTRRDIHSHNTRNRNTIDTPHIRLTKTKNSYGYNGQRLFNKLPTFLRELSLNRYKNYLKKWLTVNPIYSTNEFEEKIPTLAEE